jgi:hypothetical protein
VSGRILWVATADARGHVMRAQLLSRALAREGVAIDVVTTSDEGARFLAAFGVQADVLSRHYRVEFDGRHNMARLRTDARIARYVLDPSRMRLDVRWLAARAAGVDLVVNDSNHPALLFAPMLERTRHLRVVHVYGRNLRRALAGNFEGRAPRAVSRAHAAVVERLLARGFARIEHTLAVRARGEHDDAGRGDFFLPPVVAAPTRAAAEVRAALHVGAFERLAVIYLNPHFRDAAVASALESELGRAGFKLHAIGEGYARRAGWLPHDPSLADAIGAADLFVSGAGMGALAQARAFNVPFLSIVADQPEQVHNLAFLRGAAHPFEIVRGLAKGEPLAERLRVALARLTRPPGAALVRASATDTLADTHAAWLRVLTRLIARAQRRPVDGEMRAEERRWQAA